MPVQSISWPATFVGVAGSARGMLVTERGTGTFSGRVRDDRRHVDVDNQALAAITAAGGKVMIVDSIDDHTPGELRHDGERYALRCEASMSREASRAVEVRVRGAR